MVKTIGEAYKETKELERNGSLRARLEKLIETQEGRLDMKHLEFPKLVVTMHIYNKMYENGEIFIQYWDKETINHELGHHYFDTLCKKFNAYHLINNFKDKQITEWWEARNHFLTEGIATYFEREMKEGKDEFKDSEFPKTIKEFLRNNFNFLLRLYYDGGYHLVKPILDKFGVEEGCKHIILEPPNKKDLISLSCYRTRILTSPSIALKIKYKTFQRKHLNNLLFLFTL